MATTIDFREMSDDELREMAISLKSADNDTLSGLFPHSGFISIIEKIQLEIYRECTERWLEDTTPDDEPNDFEDFSISSEDDNTDNPSDFD